MALLFLLSQLSSLAFAAPPAAPQKAVLVFQVKVPEGTPAGEGIYLSGNLKPLGSWSPTGLRLEPAGPGRYSARVELERGAELEFKVTRGSWSKVERGKDGQDLPNRRLKVEKDAQVELEVSAWASGRPVERPSTITGEVRLHERFHSRHLENDRTLAVYLPPGYGKDPPARYPVLYLQDGQNLFNASTSTFGVEWRADETAERLIVEGRLRPLLIVGIYNNGDRMNEYTPWADAARKSGGKGDLYGRFLVEEVKPFIDRTYRTLPGRETTAIGGSSLGGLISLHLARSHKETFGLCAAVSPALLWADRALLAEWRRDLGWQKSTRFWIDMGSAEGVLGPAEGPVPAPIKDARALVELLDSAGLLPGRDYYYLEAVGAEHNEAAWAARFDKVLLYLFGK